MRYLAVLAVAIAWSQPPKAAQPRELAFNWPVGIEARVETERSRERTGAMTSSMPAVKTVQRLKVLAHPQGRLIQFDPIDVPLSTSAPALEEISQQLSGVVPSFVVAADGTLVRVEHVASLRAALEKMVGSYRKQLGTLPGELEKLMAQLTSERFLTQIAGQEWEVLVAGWTGVPLKPGLVDTQIEAPVPIFPGTTVPMNVRAGIIDFTPCTRAGVSHQCVNLESRQSVDQKGMSALLARFLAAARGRSVQSPKYDRFDVVTVVRVRLEAETMLPHEVSTVRTTEMGITEANKPRVDVKQVDRRTSKFIY